jgi:hypothetical protein
MSVTIKNRWSGNTIATVEDTDDRRKAVIQLVRQGFPLSDSNLSGSDLSGSDLRGSNLSGSDLRNSDLSDSNLSGSDLSGSNLRDSNLRNSDLRGSNLSGSDLRNSDLRNSDLRNSDLRGSDLRNSDLRNSDLSGSDLRGSDLRNSDLRNSDLSGSDLRGSNLSGSDLELFELVKVPSLHRRILAAIEAGGELNMSEVHICETTHCRAGWAVHLAGPAGKVLEITQGWAVAGAIIHFASCPELDKVPDFYASNEVALEDIRRMADMEPAI